MQNSDHANFALAGIPAMRLVAGFDDPGANLRYVLTPADTRDKVAAGRTAAIRNPDRGHRRRRVRRRAFRGRWLAQARRQLT